MKRPTKAQGRILKTLRDNEDLYIVHRVYGQTNFYELSGVYSERKKIRRGTGDALLRENWLEDWEGKLTWQKGLRISQKGLNAIAEWQDADFEGTDNEDIKISTPEILDTLMAKYAPPTNSTFANYKRYIRVTELGNDGGSRFIDLFVMDCHRGQGYFERISYEIKVSRADFVNEMKAPQKRDFALSISNYFYFATPEGLIKPSELPIEAGLVEISRNETKEFEILKVKESPYRNTLPPTWALVTKIFRYM